MRPRPSYWTEKPITPEMVEETRAFNKKNSLEVSINNYKKTFYDQVANSDNRETKLNFDSNKEAFLLFLDELKTNRFKVELIENPTVVCGISGFTLIAKISW